MEDKLELSREIYLTCQDFTVSGEKFDLLYDPEFEMLVTHPKPDPEKLPDYYKSAGYISHTDSRSTLTDKIYQRVKKVMLQKKLKWISNEVSSKGKILDIGAGTGDFLLEAKKEGWNVFGFEPDGEARNLAKAKGIVLQENLDSLKEEKFDVITLWHVLEHVYDLNRQIVFIESILKKGGLLIIAVPNFKSYDAQHYREYWAAYDVPRHLWHFSQNSFKKLFAPTTLRFFKTRPLLFDSFYVSILSEKYSGKENNYLKAFTIGAKSNFKAMSSSEYSSLAYFFRKSV